MKHKLFFATAATALLTITTLTASAQTKVSEAAWGKTTDGKPVAIFSLEDADLAVRITTFGARVVSINAPDRDGKKDDVVLGYSNVGSYEADKSTYFGAIVGRYGNRIANGTFTIDGHTYHLPTNDHGQTLHGGPAGFSTKVWVGKQIPDGVEMTLVSPDGDMGFPGELTAHVRYTLQGSSLRIDYSATTTKPTVVNLTNHSYFNLGGQASGDILNEKLMINADRYTPVDPHLIPTGELSPLTGSPFDFQQPFAIGARINQPNAQLKIAGGYDHNFVLNGASGAAPRVAAKLLDPTTGRTLTVLTTEPGVQFYSGNFLDGTAVGITGTKYQKHAALCLETQHFPDSPNHPSFPSTTLRPGQTLHSTTIFTFGVAK
jgi:aldose 1-epimerase